MAYPPRIICIGAMHWDVVGRSPRQIDPGDDVPGRIHRTPGGVALNIALGLARRGLDPIMLSAVGRDMPGDLLIAEARRHGVDTRHLWRNEGLPTDMYLAIETPKGLMAAVADTHAIEAAANAILIPLREGPLGSARNPCSGIMVIDGNLALNVIAGLAHDPSFARAQLRAVPASPDKATRFRPLLAHPTAIFHLNLPEAEALIGRPFSDTAAAAEAVLTLGAARAIVTDGPRTAADALRNGPTLSQTPPAVTAIRVTGAGDSFVAAHLAAELGGATREQALAAALHTSAAHVSGKEQP